MKDTKVSEDLTAPHLQGGVNIQVAVFRLWRRIVVWWHIYVLEELAASIFRFWHRLGLQ